jgi:hypothetical protein
MDVRDGLSTGGVVDQQDLTVRSGHLEGEVHGDDGAYASRSITSRARGFDWGHGRR